MTAEPATLDRAIEHELGVDGLLVLRLRIEDLRIRAVEGTKVRIAARDGRSLAGLGIVRGQRSLELDTAGTPGRDLIVDVPTGTNLVVESSNSDIEVDGVAGDQRYSTVSGDIELRRVAGAIAIDAMSGDIGVAIDGRAELDIRSVSGDIAVRADAIARLRASTTSGDLMIAGRFDGDGPYSIETVSGDATVAPAGDVRIAIRTITGEVRSDLAARLEETPDRRTLVIGTTGPTIDFRSTSGDLRVARTAERPTLAPATDALPESAAADPVADDLAVLRALERGDIDVAEARRRLATLDAHEPDPDGDATDRAPTAVDAPEETPDA